MKQRPLLLILWAGLTACSGNTSSSETGTSSTTTDMPISFFGSWVYDVSARTPPDPQPDHYDRTEYEIGRGGGGATLAKYSAALDLKTRKVLFRESFSAPKPCTYIPERKCLACGEEQQAVKDSLFLEAGKLVNRSPLATNQAAAGRGPLVLARKPEETTP